MKGNLLKLDKLNGAIWTDKDHVMLHAIFQVLCDFVEKEHPFKDKTRRPYDRAMAMKFFRQAYRYWNVRRPSLILKLDKLRSECASISSMRFIPHRNPKFRPHCEALIEVKDEKRYNNIKDKISHLESVIDDADREYLAGILEHRKHMWM